MFGSLSARLLVPRGFAEMCGVPGGVLIVAAPWELDGEVADEMWRSLGDLEGDEVREWL